MINDMKTILLLLLSACWLPIQAQQSSGMFYEGKRWNYIHRYIDKELEQYAREHPEKDINFQFQEEISYVVHSDTIIGDTQCYKMYYESPDTSYYERACCEKDSVIYFVLAGSDNFKMFYDRRNHIGEDLFYDYIGSVDKVVRDKEYTFDSYGDTAGPVFVWIYPVGTFTYGFLYNSYIVFTKWEGIFFESISDEEGIVVTCEDLENLYEKILADIDKIPNRDKIGRKVIYDLSGRRADGKKPGVYIKNGKKFVIK